MSNMENNKEAARTAKTGHGKESLFAISQGWMSSSYLPSLYEPYWDRQNRRLYQPFQFRLERGIDPSKASKVLNPVWSSHRVRNFKYTNSIQNIKGSDDWRKRRLIKAPLCNSPLSKKPWWDSKSSRSTMIIAVPLSFLKTSWIKIESHMFFKHILCYLIQIKVIQNPLLKLYWTRSSSSRGCWKSRISCLSLTHRYFILEAQLQWIKLYKLANW